MARARERHHSEDLGDAVTANPFDTREIQQEIYAALLQIQRDMFEWIAEPICGTEDQTVSTLVKTLDVYGHIYVRALQAEEEIPAFAARLRQEGTALLHRVTDSMQDPYSEEALLRTVCSPSFEYAIRRKSREQQHELRARAVNRLGAESMNSAKEWHSSRNALLFTIESRFEARHRHWLAEAMARKLPRKGSPPSVAGEPRCAMSWSDVEITFTSDTRVSIRTGEAQTTHNYGELGFGSGKSGNPIAAWVMLRQLAEGGGTILRREGRADWSKVQKQAQRLRALLGKHFRIAEDPLPYVRGVGYRTRFKLRCGPSFHT